MSITVRVGDQVVGILTNLQVYRGTLPENVFTLPLIPRSGPHNLGFVRGKAWFGPDVFPQHTRPLPKRGA